MRRGTTVAGLDRAGGCNSDIGVLASTTRIARNGRVVALLDEELADGDEIALLPPVGGG